MRLLAVIVAHMASSSHGRRLQGTVERSREGSFKAPAHEISELLLASQPAVGWQATGPGLLMSGRPATPSVAARRSDVVASSKWKEAQNLKRREKIWEKKKKAEGQNWKIEDEDEDKDLKKELKEAANDGEVFESFESRSPDDPAPVGFGGGEDSALDQADEWFQRVEARRVTDRNSGRPEWIREKRNKILLRWSELIKSKGDINAPRGRVLAHLKNVSVELGGESILKSVDWEICQGQVIGLIGESGCGKSTQLRILAGELPADAGEVWHASLGDAEAEQSGEAPTQAPATACQRPAVLHVQQTILANLSIEPRSLTEFVRDTLAADGCDPIATEAAVWRWVGWQAPSSKTDEVSDDSAAEARGRSWFGPGALSRPVRELSSGQQLRLAISVALARRPHLLLCDEPTNHLDVFGLLWLESAMKKAVKSGEIEAIAAVSHDRAFLEGACNHIVDASGGGSNLYTGSYAIYLKVKESRAESLAMRDVDDGEVVQPPADARKAPSRFRFASDGEDEEQIMVELRGADVRAGAQATYRAKDGAAQTSSESRLPPVLLHGVNLEVCRGERLLIVGPNGIGKSSLLRAVAGATNAMPAGERRVADEVDAFVFDQDAAETLSGPTTAVEWLHSVSPNVTEDKIFRITKQLGIPRSVQHTSLDGLSGGEKARLCIAQMLLSQKNFLILDEPTNHLDLHARAYLQEAIRYFDGGIIFASHDRHFAAAVASRVIAMDPVAAEDGSGFGVSLTQVPSFKAYLESRPEERAAFTLRADPHRQQLDSDLGPSRGRSLSTEPQAEEQKRSESKQDPSEPIKTISRLSTIKSKRKWARPGSASAVTDESRAAVDLTQPETSHVEEQAAGTAPNIEERAEIEEQVAKIEEQAEASPASMEEHVEIDEQAAKIEEAGGIAPNMEEHTEVEDWAAEMEGQAGRSAPEIEEQDAGVRDPNMEREQAEIEEHAAEIQEQAAKSVSIMEEHAEIEEQATEIEEQAAGSAPNVEENAAAEGQDAEIEEQAAESVSNIEEHAEIQEQASDTDEQDAGSTPNMEEHAEIEEQAVEVEEQAAANVPIMEDHREIEEQAAEIEEQATESVPKIEEHSVIEELAAEIVEQAAEVEEHAIVEKHAAAGSVPKMEEHAEIKEHSADIEQQAVARHAPNLEEHAEIEEQAAEIEDPAAESVPSIKEQNEIEEQAAEIEEQSKGSVPKMEENTDAEEQAAEIEEQATEGVSNVEEHSETQEQASDIDEQDAGSTPNMEEHAEIEEQAVEVEEQAVEEQAAGNVPLMEMLREIEELAAEIEEQAARSIPKIEEHAEIEEKSPPAPKAEVESLQQTVKEKDKEIAKLRSLVDNLTTREQLIKLRPLITKIKAAAAKVPMIEEQAVIVIDDQFAEMKEQARESAFSIDEHAVIQEQADEIEEQAAAGDSPNMEEHVDVMEEPAADPVFKPSNSEDADEFASPENFESESDKHVASSPVSAVDDLPEPHTFQAMSEEPSAAGSSSNGGDDFDDEFDEELDDEFDEDFDEEFDEESDHEFNGEFTNADAADELAASESSELEEASWLVDEVAEPTGPPAKSIRKAAAAPETGSRFQEWEKVPAKPGGRNIKLPKHNFMIPTSVPTRSADQKRGKHGKVAARLDEPEDHASSFDRPGGSVFDAVASHMSKVEAHHEKQQAKAPTKSKLVARKRHPNAVKIAAKQVRKKRMRMGTWVEPEKKVGFWNEIKKYKIGKRDNWRDENGDEWKYR